jgi:hypothetical protein
MKIKNNDRGINLKMKKGEVFLDDKNNYTARKRWIDGEYIVF